MSGVRREVAIGWKGQEYTFAPTNRLLRRIEDEVPLANLLSDLAARKIKLSHLAFVLAECLRAAGAEIDEDEMLAELVGADAAQVYALAEAVLGAIFPVDPAGKKPRAPAAPPAPGAGPRKAKKKVRRA